MTVTVLGLGGAGGGVVGNGDASTSGGGGGGGPALAGIGGGLASGSDGCAAMIEATTVPWRVAVEQPAVLITHHVVAAGEQCGQPRIGGDAGIDEPDGHSRAGGVSPCLGDVQHHVARRGLRDVRRRHGQRDRRRCSAASSPGRDRAYRPAAVPRGRRQAVRWPRPPRASSRWPRAAAQPLPPQMRSALAGEAQA